MASEVVAAMTDGNEGAARSKSRRSIFKRFRKKSSKNQQPEEPVPVTPEKAVRPEEDDDGRTVGTATPPPTPTEEDGVPELELSHDGTPEMEAAADRPQSPTTKDGVPVLATSAADEFLPSEVREHDGEVNKRGDSFLGALHDGTSLSTKESSSPKKGRSKGGRTRSTVVLKQAPSAKDAAFGGPPRYDWIDIETAAAVKVQAAYRRNKVMWELEKEGKSTAAMRNRMRAQNSRKKAMQSEDVPFPLACCGVGFLFGDATGEDDAVLDMHRKQEYEEKRRQKEEEEAMRRKLRYRHKASDHIVEEYEVVDPEGEENDGQKAAA